MDFLLFTYFYYFITKLNKESVNKTTTNDVKGNTKEITQSAKDRNQNPALRLLSDIGSLHTLRIILIWNCLAKNLQTVLIPVRLEQLQ